ncbi:hemolysin family protein [Thalassiella azotivora]
MDQDTWLNVLLVVAFVLVGGVFAGTEIALVSLRDSQVAQLEQRGARGARVARVARDPNRFLASVQIGVTVAGFFSAAYGASTLADDVEPVLVGWGLSEGAAATVALVGLTLAIAYLSLVLGELVPKRLALQRAAGVSLLVGPALDRFATLARPVVWLLSRSTDVVVRLLGGDPRATSEVMTEEELRDLVVTHDALADEERRILRDVLDATDRSLVEVMRPRGRVTFLPLDGAVGDVLAAVRDAPHSRYPVVRDGFDDVVGFVHVRDLLGVPEDEPLRSHLRPLLRLPGTNPLLPTLSEMRRRRAHLALVVDEYGGTDGIVTLEDLVEELVGEIGDEYDTAPPPVGTGGRDVDAGFTIEEFAERTGVTLLDGPYETAAGYVLHRLGRVAVVGDEVEAAGHRLVVTGTDGRRITTVAVDPPPDGVPAPDEHV